MEFYSCDNKKENNIEKALVEEKLLPKIEERVNQYAALEIDKKDIKLERKTKVDDVLKFDKPRTVCLLNSKEALILTVAENKYCLSDVKINKVDEKIKKIASFEKMKNNIILFARSNIQKELGEKLCKDDIQDIKYQDTENNIDTEKFDEKISKISQKYGLEARKYIGIIDADKIEKIEDISEKLFELIYAASYSIVKENPCENLQIVCDENHNIIALRGDLQEAEDKCVEIIDKIVDNLNNINCGKSEQLEYALEIIKFEYNIASQIKLLENEQDALDNYYETLDSIEKVFSKSTSIGVLKCKAECHNRIAEIFQKKGEYTEAFDEISKAIETRKQVIKKFEDKNIKFDNMHVKVTTINGINLDTEKDCLMDDYLELSKIYYSLYNKHFIFKNKKYLSQANAYSDKVLKARTYEYEEQVTIDTTYNLIYALNNYAEKKEKNIPMMWRYYEKSLNLFNNLILNSDDIKALKIVVNNLEEIYNMHKKSKKISELSNYIDKILEQIKYVALELNTEESLTLLSTAYTEIGAMYCDIGKVRKSVEISKDGIQLLQNIVNKYPDKVDLVQKFRLIVKTEKKLADKLDKIGNKEEAAQHYMVTRALLNNLKTTCEDEDLEVECTRIDKILTTKFKKILKEKKLLGPASL